MNFFYDVLVPPWIIFAIAALVFAAYPAVDGLPAPILAWRMTPPFLVMVIYGFIQQTPHLEPEHMLSLGRWVLLGLLLSEFVYHIWYFIRRDKINYSAVIDEALHKQVGELARANHLLGMKLAEEAGEKLCLRDENIKLKDEIIKLKNAKHTD